MEGTIAEIRLFAGDFAPRHWLACEGQLLEIEGHAPLFSLIGARFGGDGRIDFRLPDLRDKSPQEGLKFCICIEGQFPSRS